MCRRAETEDIEQQSLIVAFPTIWDKAVLRPPAMSQRRSAVAGPVPVGPLVECVGKAADLGLIGRVAVKIGGDRPDSTAAW